LSSSEESVLGGGGLQKKEWGRRLFARGGVPGKKKGGEKRGKRRAPCSTRQRGFSFPSSMERGKRSLPPGRGVISLQKKKKGEEKKERCVRRETEKKKKAPQGLNYALVSWGLAVPGGGKGISFARLNRGKPTSRKGTGETEEQAPWDFELLPKLLEKKKKDLFTWWKGARSLSYHGDEKKRRLLFYKGKKGRESLFKSWKEIPILPLKGRTPTVENEGKGGEGSPHPGPLLYK